MRRYLFPLIVLFPLVVAGADVQAQCTGPYCSPYNYGTIPYSQPDNRNQQLDNNIPADLAEKIRQASVLVYAGSPRSYVYAKGTGTIVKWGVCVAVLTAAHVVVGQEATWIVWQENKINCQLIDYDKVEDIAILEPLEQQEQLYQVGVEPVTGLTDLSVVYLAGFDGGKNLRIVKAQEVNYITRQAFGSSLGLGRQYTWFEFNRPSRSGDSGGGVFLPDGRLACVLHSTTSSSTFATWIESATSRMNAKATCFLWRFRRRPPEPQQPPEIPKPNPSPVQPAPEPPKPPETKPPETKPPEEKTPPHEEKTPPHEEKPPVTPPQEKVTPWYEQAAIYSIYVVVGFVSFLAGLALMNILWAFAVVRRR